ncbi:MAG: tetratricopeptide repeat protein [bacterium]|nr:tetratricopeptide repeat protein [bacterium]
MPMRFLDCRLWRYEEAITVLEKSLEIKADNPETYYYLACCHSLQKDKEKALQYLRKSIDVGFKNLAHIEKDKDLDFIRDEKEYKEIITTIKPQ